MGDEVCVMLRLSNRGRIVYHWENDIDAGEWHINASNRVQILPNAKVTCADQTKKKE